MFYMEEKKLPLKKWEFFSALLFPAFAFFLDLPHLLPGDELIIRPETAKLMQGVGKSAAPVERHIALVLDVRKVHLL